MDTLKNIMLVSLPACSFLAMLFFSKRAKENKDLKYLPHIFSVVYLLVLCIFEIHEIIDGNFVRWFFVLFIFSVVFILSKDRNVGIFKYLSHSSHVEFSNVIAVIFVIHSFGDGFVLADGHHSLLSGILIHRLFDGILLFGLIYEKGLSIKNFFVFILFLFAPVFASSIGGSIESLSIVRSLFVFLMFCFVVLDILSELNHSHGVKGLKVFATVVLATLCAVFLAH